MCCVTDFGTCPVQCCQAKASVNPKQCSSTDSTLCAARVTCLTIFIFTKNILRLLSQGPELNEEQREQEAQWGPPRGDPTQWASCLRVVDPSTLESASVLELDNNEAALSMCCVRFTGGEEFMLAIGTVQNLGFYPRAADGRLPAAYSLSLLGSNVRRVLHLGVYTSSIRTQLLKGCSFAWWQTVSLQAGAVSCTFTCGHKSSLPSLQSMRSCYLRSTDRKVDYRWLFPILLPHQHASRWVHGRKHRANIGNVAPCGTNGHQLNSLFADFGNPKSPPAPPLLAGLADQEPCRT